jgi:hypothetical protein
MIKTKSAKTMKLSTAELHDCKTAELLPNTEYRIPNTEYRIPNTEYRIPNTEYRIPITDY